MKGWAREGDFYGNSIAVAIRSLDHSLSIRLIAPTVWGEIEIYSSPNGDKVKGFAVKNSTNTRRTPLT